MVEWCLKMARVGMALTKNNVIELATDLISGTDASVCLEDFKQKRNLTTRDGEKIVVGRQWYNGFIQRNREQLKIGKCKVKDQKRRTWFTYEHFSNMYDGVYDVMVKSKVAIK
jgi:hypothetical protein